MKVENKISKICWNSEGWKFPRTVCYVCVDVNYCLQRKRYLFIGYAGALLTLINPHLSSQIEKFSTKSYHSNMHRVEDAASLFGKGFNCTQSVLTAYGTELGLNKEIALKIASAFGGGMGLMGETCGAVTGAFMVIGLKYGVTEPHREAEMKTYKLVEKFVNKFKSRNNSILCKELLGFDIASPTARKIAKKKCPKYVRDAAEIIEEIL